jgi:hypothetical protein
MPRLEALADFLAIEKFTIVTFSTKPASDISDSWLV